ncbi:YbhB/YbcL family Raf kinase inhibitor-like protein [Streptomyces sp. NPDC020298]|uniref:YbhB/YbcL family Raf kinase inhibitor-like protein n=1 Tax=unclassified Streptomyces TaxID=2593676 RepID=UPI0033C480D2
MRPGSVIATVVTAIGVVSGCADTGGGDSSAPSATAAHRITVTSSAFAEGGTIPRRHTCDGEDVSPPLALTGVPAHTAALVVLAEDPDAPHGTFTHWLVWGIDPHETRLAAGRVPADATQGRNGFGKTGYGGPCPPRGDRPHRYVFSVYATDRPLNGLPSGATADTVRTALTGHTLAQGTLTGRYGR